MTTQKQQVGFSLVELLIVVAIVGIISAIAIPNFFSSRRAANESSAVATLRVLFSAQSTYRTTAGSYGDLMDLQNVGLIDSVVAASDTTAKSGYLFNTGPVNGPSYPTFDATGEPTTATGPLATGARSYFVNETGVIHFALSGTAPTCTPDDARTIAGGSPLNN
jgi:prepilin-type N-terminal cleavage/methylation domain-containing protein